MLNDSYKNIYAQYAVWLGTLGFSSSIVYNNKFRARDFFEWLENRGVYAVKLIDQKHVVNYYEYLQTRPIKYSRASAAFGGSGLSETYLNNNFIAIDKLFEFLHQIGTNAAPSPTNFRIKQDKNERIYKIEILTKDEIKTLQANIGNTYGNLSFTKRETRHEQLKLIFALHYGCGLRRSEGFKLTTPDIDFDKKTIFVRQGKNYKDRVVPMNVGVLKVVEN